MKDAMVSLFVYYYKGVYYEYEEEEEHVYV